MIKTQLFCAIVLLALGFNAKGQTIYQLTAEHADCINAIDISGQKHVVATAPTGYGMQMDVSAKKKDLKYFEREHNTVWYKFVAEEDALMSLLITPDKPTDDYDFILFECQEGSCCEQIQSKALVPVRSNISRTNVERNGVTGLSLEGTTDYVHEGVGNNYSNPLLLKKGAKYFLVLDNVYGGNGGHKIDFFMEPIVKEQEIPFLNLKVVDAASDSLIEADITLIRFSEDFTPDTVLQQTDSALTYSLAAETYYEILVFKDEYLKAKNSFKIKQEDSVLNIEIPLQNVSVGSSFELKKVYFQGGTANFVGNSQSALRKLYAVMKDNPELSIEIQGHVNLPNGSYRRRTEESYYQLSLDRAKAVYDYLVKRGIDPSRLEYKGFGYSQMIYPDATSSDEMQQNRRVEIKVLDN